MKNWEIKYLCPTVGASHTLTLSMEASEKGEAENLFKEIHPLEEIISINEVNKKTLQT
jgi:hypothetical protein